MENPTIKALYESFGIDEKELTTDRSNKYRLNAINIRGVNEMSTEDILDYFDKFRCSSVEWINDYSCNAVWPDSNSAAEAMLAVSKPLNSNAIDVDMEDEVNSSEVVLINDDEEKSVDSSNSDDEEEKVIPMKTSSEMKSSETDIKTLGIPVPPGKWRLGNPHEKSKAIVMRFALMTDKKLPGAEKRSKYYMKYGNPNYGGMVGLISKSKKRKYREIKAKDEKVDFPAPDPDLPTVQNSEEDYRSEEGSNQTVTKKLRMKMYADQEIEQKLKKDNQDGDDLRHKLSSNRRHNLKVRHVTTYDDIFQEPCVDLRAKLEKKGELNNNRNKEGNQTDLRKKLNRLHEEKKWGQPITPLVIELLPEKN